MMRSTLCSLATSIVLLARPSTSDAGCITPSVGTANWADTTERRIYILHDPGNPTIGLTWGTGLSFPDVEKGVKRTISLLNEESGSATKFIYAGTQIIGTPQAGSILLTGKSCSDGLNGRALGVGGQTFFTFTAGNTIIDRAEVTAYRSAGDDDGNCNPMIRSFEEGSFYELMFHELGHAAFRMAHPNSQTSYCTDWTFFTPSVMLAETDTKRTLVFKDYDMFHFQANTAPRGQFGEPHRSYTNGAGWTSGAPLTTPNTLFIHNSWGSIPSGTGTSRLLPYVRNGSTTPVANGTGTQAVGIPTGASFSTYTTYGTGTAMMRPQAVAQKPSSNNALWAYVKREYSSNNLDSDIGRVCYRYSTDAGVTWASEVCQTGASYLVARGGVSAAYDPQSNSFLVGFIGGSATITGASSRRVNLLVLPGPGNTAPVTPLFTGVYSYHAPSIACRASTSGTDKNCLLHYENIDVGTSEVISGCARHRDLRVTSGTTPSISYSAVTGTGCVATYVQPSVAFSSATSELYLVQTELGDSVNTYKRAYAATSWTSFGTPFVSASNIVTGAAIGEFAWNGVPRMEAWYTKISN